MKDDVKHFPWTHRIEQPRDGFAHGITFLKWERGGPNVRGEAAHGAKKLHMDGVASMTLALNQYRYGDELIAQIFTRERGLFFERRAETYNRVQIYFGLADARTADMLEDVAAHIRSRIRNRT